MILGPLPITKRKGQSAWPEYRKSLFLRGFWSGGRIFGSDSMWLETIIEAENASLPNRFSVGLESDEDTYPIFNSLGASKDPKSFSRFVRSR
jgi:hypothetical protein